MTKDDGGGGPKDDVIPNHPRRANFFLGFFFLLEHKAEKFRNWSKKKKKVHKNFKRKKF